MSAVRRTSGPDCASTSLWRDFIGKRVNGLRNVLPEILETERLVVRVARPGDGPMLNRAILESREELKRWLGWVTPPPTVEQSELSCRRAYARFLLNEDLMAFFILRESGALVGGSGLHRANWELRRFEVGYWGRTAYRRWDSVKCCALATACAASSPSFAAKTADRRSSSAGHTPSS